MPYTDKLDSLRTALQNAIDATTGGAQVDQNLYQALALLNGAYGNSEAQAATLAALNSKFPAWLVDRSVGSAISRVVKASAGRVFAVQCVNSATNTRFLQFFDRATALAGGETPIASYPVYGNGGLLSLGLADFGIEGTSFATGICWGVSSTMTTYTAAGAGSSMIVLVRYL